LASVGLALTLAMASGAAMAAAVSRARAIVAARRKHLQRPSVDDRPSAGSAQRLRANLFQQKARDRWRQPRSPGLAPGRSG